MQQQLREFVEAADARISKTFRKKGRVLPMYHFVDGRDRHLVTPVPNADKNTAMKIVRASFAMMEVKRYVFITEAWIMEAKGGAGVDRLKSYMQENSLEHLACRRNGRRTVLPIRDGGSSPRRSAGRAPGHRGGCMIFRTRGAA